MSANTVPIFPVTPVVTWASGAAANAGTPGVTANTTKDLTSGTSFNIYTAGANGSRVDYVRIRALGTNSSATVCRIWLNNGSTTATAANNTLLTESTIASTTLSETAALAETTIGINATIPAGYRLYATFGFANAAGFHVTTFGGDY